MLIQGFWTLSHGDKVIRRNFDVQLDQQQDGYPDLVRTLSLGWQQVADNIAKEIAKY